VLKYLLIGGGFAFAAAVQPGPLQAYLFSKVTSAGWKKTLPAAFSPLLSDIPIAFIVLVILGQLSITAQSILRAAGGILLIYLAWKAFIQWKKHAVNIIEKQEKVPHTFFEAALVNFLNPNPYLGWALILGPVVVEAWQINPATGIAVIVSFYATMIVMLALIIFAFGSTQYLGAKFQKRLVLVSAIILAGIGVYQLVLSIGLYF